MNTKNTFHTSLNVQDADINTPPSPFNDDIMEITIRREDGYEAKFKLPTYLLDDLLGNLTVALHAAGYVYVKRLEAIREGEDD